MRYLFLIIIFATFITTTQLQVNSKLANIQNSVHEFTAVATPELHAIPQINRTTKGIKDTSVYAAEMQCIADRRALIQLFALNPVDFCYAINNINGAHSIISNTRLKKLLLALIDHRVASTYTLIYDATKNIKLTNRAIDSLNNIMRHITGKSIAPELIADRINTWHQANGAILSNLKNDQLERLKYSVILEKLVEIICKPK